MKIPTKWRLTKWQWVLVVTMAVLALMSSLVDRYLPWFWAQAWYLRHMNGVTYMGKVIPVPRGIVGGDRSLPAYDSISFEQFSPTIHGHRGPIAWGMSFSPDTIPHATPEDAVKQLGINLTEFADRIHTTVGPAFAVETEEGNGWCYTMTYPKASFVMTSCVLFNAQWSASYDGPPGDEKEFFKVLAGIHDAKK